ncbi:uncharacterized protein [Typha angustifolia]|uniref:uncharacterized protein n=1 Tax=Typha angustifolia TaxID=59011 RepID=UPI003C2D7D7A
MRDFVSCFGDSSVNLSSESHGTATCVYKSTLSTRKEILTKITWSKNNSGVSLSVSIEDNVESRPKGQLLTKKKGSRSFVTDNLVISLYWDISIAKYGAGSEPVDDYYFVVVADAEFSLLLGDMSRDFVKRFEGTIPTADFCILSRQEQVHGTTVYSTRSRFRGDGKDHEISIRCKGDEGDSKDAELVVSIDKKKVVQVRRLRWNFRGNQTIFVDGSVVDLMWDIHDWWFCDRSGCALFMFKTRSSSESRHLWLDEELTRSGQDAAGFFLLIEAFKKI